MGRVYLSQRTGNNSPGESMGIEAARRPRRGLLLGLALAGLWLLAPAAGAEGIYRYVDARGVVHFTNVNPDDDRYQRFRMPASYRIAPKNAVRPVRIYDPTIRRHAMEQGIPPALVKAVIHAESAFDPRAVSPKGAMGLMQLMPDTARMLGVLEPFAAEQNIDGGVRYLRTLHDRYGSWTHTLAAYNAGPTAVDRYRGVPPYAETREYVRRVLSYYRRYHGDFPR